MTEVGVTSVELSPDVKQRLNGYIGKPLNGVEYKVNEADNELLIKSPTIHIREIIAEMYPHQSNASYKRLDQRDSYSHR